MPKHIAGLLLAGCAFSLFLGSAQAQGLANKYPGDAGIENDADVIFSEDFESGSISNVASRFTSQKNTGGMSFVPDKPAKSVGANSLQLTSVGGANTGAHLFKRLDQNHDQLYIRCYVKWAEGGTYHHSGLRMCGYDPPSSGPQGTAGIKPTGTERFTCAFEPFGAGNLNFYSYWMHMRCWGDSALNQCHGNSFVNNTDDPLTFNGISLDIAPSRWICVEFMIKCNTPVTSYNGELQLWLDGQEVIHLGEGFPMGQWTADKFRPNYGRPQEPFEGFQWRKVTALALNQIGLQHYVTGDPAGYVGKMWFDDLVVARSYVGPIWDGNPHIQLRPSARPDHLLLNCAFGPFNSVLSINYALPTPSSNGSLRIHSLSGRAIRQFAIAPETNAIRWRPKHDGVYVVTLGSQSQRKSERVAVIEGVGY